MRAADGKLGCDFRWPNRGEEWRKSWSVSKNSYPWVVICDQFFLRDKWAIYNVKENIRTSNMQVYFSIRCGSSCVICCGNIRSSSVPAQFLSGVHTGGCCRTSVGSHSRSKVAPMYRGMILTINVWHWMLILLLYAMDVEMVFKYLSPPAWLGVLAAGEHWLMNHEFYPLHLPGRQLNAGEEALTLFKKGQISRMLRRKV